MVQHAAPAVALWLIAAILAADFAFDHIRPVVVLAMNRQAYMAAARTCHESRFYSKQAAAAAERLDPGTAAALHRSAAVTMMGCHPRDSLAQELLGAGVNEHALEQLDLEARLLSRAGLPDIAARLGQ